MDKLFKNIDFINIVLIVISLGLACYLPFEVFLLAYGILGPLHYLTEISWLKDKSYFLKNKTDIYVLLILFIFIILGSSIILPFDFLNLFKTYLVIPIYFCFCWAFICVLHVQWKERINALVYVLIGGIILFFPIGIIIFLVLLPTLIHVYIFTALFILFGALKSKSKLGVLSFFCLLIGGILCFMIPSNMSILPNEWAKLNYQETFGSLSEVILTSIFGQNNIDIFNHPLAIKVGRFIAFAYTYHYLNWFSKTSIIKWHQAPKKRLVIIVSIWLICAITYLYNYILGFKLLFLLSFLHVILEFPLNAFIIKELFKNKRKTD